jgi:hypothetical protein
MKDFITKINPKVNSSEYKVNVRSRADHIAQSMAVSDEEESEAAILSSLAKQDLCTSKPDNKGRKSK